MSDNQDAKEKRAAELWNQLKDETELTPEQQAAIPEQQNNWHHQENDPAHVPGNSATAAEDNKRAAEQVDLTTSSMPTMTQEEKAAHQKVLEEELKAMQDLSQEPEQEH